VIVNSCDDGELEPDAVPLADPRRVESGVSSDRPVVVLRPAPQPVRRIFSEPALARLNERFRVLDLSEDSSDGGLDDVLPEAFAIIGQPDLPRQRILSAPRLRAVLNVEGNFYPNVDYPACFQAGIHVLGCGPAYAQAVAEYALGLALDLARGISREDRAFRAGEERYLGDGNQDAVHLRRSDVGLVGFGNLGRALHRLLVPFGATVRVYDPWLPDAVLREADVMPCSLEAVLARSRFLFVLATVTEASEHLLDGARLDLVQRGARLVLVSRAAVVDYDALLDRVATGQFLAGIDVWPAEPLAAAHRARSMPGLVLSAHRAGATPQAFTEIGDMVVDDLTLIVAGLPPARMQIAARELVGRYRNRPAK
jgi:phosphoglycerate dehydrogenase-like enzyme